MVKRWKPLAVLAVTLVLAVSLENPYFLFLLGFEIMVCAACFVQVRLMAKRVRMRLVLPDRMAFRGESFQVRAELTNTGRIPIPQLMARIRLRVFPEKELLLLRGKTMLGGGETGNLCFQLDSEHCACLELAPDQLMLTDYLGIFQRRCAVDETEKHLLFVLPECLKTGTQIPEIQGVLPGEDGEEERRGSTSIDVAEIRTYQQGDSIKLVHWKLSARLEELLVREMSDPTEQLARIYLNLRENDAKHNTRADADAWDRFMEAVANVSSALLWREKKHVVIWPDAARDELIAHTVTDEDSQQRMLCELLRAETFHTKDYLPLFKEVYADEAAEASIEIDLQGRADRSAA